MSNEKLKCFGRQDFYCVLLGAAIGFMFCIFAPLDAFFANKNEFWFSLSQLLPMLGITFVSFTVIFSIFMILAQRTKAASYIYGVLLYVYLFFYIQGNYIPRDYGVLNGTEIDWSSYGAYGIMSVVLAVVCVLLCVFSLSKLKDRIYGLGKYLCTFIILIQVITIGVVWIRDAVSGEEPMQETRVVTNKDLLNLSEDNNFIILLLDTFDSQDMLNLLQGDDAEEYRELFSGGFTFYPDTLGAYPTTKAAVPQILTGIWYYNDRPYTEYLQDAYRDSPFMEALRTNDYSVGLYTEDRLLSQDADMYINVDLGTYYVNNYYRFAVKVYQLVAFNYMPHQLKKYFDLDTGEFEELKDTSLGGGAYSYDVQANYAYLLQNGVSVTEKGNCFRFYHTAGVHPYYTFGKDLVTEAGVTYDVYDEAEGNCTFLKTYIDELKKKGIYDSSTIIIMADHGHCDYSQNPLFMIKNAGETDGFVISQEKMWYAYLPDIFVSLANGEKVTEEYIRNYRDEERHYLFYTWDDSWKRAYLPRMQELYADGYAGDVDRLRMTGREYIGRDDYTHNGDVVCKFERGALIDTIYFYSDLYNADRYVVKGLSQQEELGTWTEGEELIISFPLHDIDAPFIGVNIEISTVFNPPQSVKVLINGKYVCEEIIRNGTNMEFAFENPGTDVAELTLLLPDSVAPSDISDSVDDRKLALGLLTMEVAEAEYEFSKIPEDGIIHFDARDYNANAYVVSGISAPEENAAWTVGDKLLAYFGLKGGSAADTIHIAMDLKEVAGEQQGITIEVNGAVVFDGTVSEGEDAVSFDIPYPEDEIISMVVYMPNAASTADSESSCLMIKDIKISQ